MGRCPRQQFFEEGRMAGGKMSVPVAVVRALHAVDDMRRAASAFDG